MTVNNRTSNRDYPKPNVSNLLSEDVVRLAEALDDIDTDVAALQSRAPLASPTFTGTPAAPTPAADTDTTQLATTAFVKGQTSTDAPAMAGTAAAGSSSRFARADHRHPIDTSRAPVASPTFTGTPAAPTAAVDTNTSQVATTAYVVGQDYTKQTRQLFAGTGLTGGGDLSANRTFAIANSGVTSAMIADGAIVNADINDSAGIVDTKLATISTAGKVSNSATTATSGNVANAIVARNANGDIAIRDLYASGDVYAFVSDIRLKTCIEPIDNALKKVLSLHGFTYSFNRIGEELGFDVSARHSGVSAQDVQEVLPEAVCPAPANENYLTVKYDKIIPLLIEAIKEQQQQIHALIADAARG